MTTFKKVMLASALMATPFLTQAGVYNLSANNAGSDGYHGVFTIDTTGAFSDFFRFNLDTAATFGAFASSFDVDSFTSISIDNSFFGTTNTEFFGPITHNIAEIGTSVISAGTHYLRVQGTGVAGDQYTLDMAPMSTVSPVPEPSTLGLMFGGVALVGMIAYRSRKA